MNHAGKFNRLMPAGLRCAALSAGFVTTAQDSKSSAPPAGNVASALTQARTPRGQYISWREHIIDDTALAGVPISGSDGLVMADLDRDGFLDIVSVHESDTQYDGVADGHIRIAFGSADPGRWVLTTLAQGPEAGAAEDAAIGDINGDGYPDVIAACELAHLIYLQNPGANARSAHWQRLILPMTKNRGSYIRVFLADFNSDGQLEAVAPNKGEQNPDPQNRTRHALSVYSVAGNPLVGSSWKETVIGESIIPQNARPVDLDGDGDLDVVGGSRGENRIMWFENLGQSSLEFQEHPIDIDGGSSGGFNFAFGDLSGDGRLDIVLLAGAALGNGLAWIEQPARPPGKWTLHSIGNMMPDRIVGFTLADIDGDGDPDIMSGSYSGGPRDADGEVTRNDRLGRIAWFEQSGNPKSAWTRHDISRRKRGMFDKFVGRDLDGDGDLDFVSTRGNSDPYDGVFWLEQVRTDRPTPAFVRARKADSMEMPLPGDP